MNQYSSWKYILILLTVGLSLLYVTPNFYGESFAVQVMPVKAGETIDRSTLKLVESSLDKAKIQNIGIVFVGEGGGQKVGQQTKYEKNVGLARAGGLWVCFFVPYYFFFSFFL